MEEVPESQSAFDVEGSMWPSYCNPSYVMPSEIKVKISSSISGNYSFPVSIVKKTGKKPYFGGYRNKLTGKVYHHTSSQTPTENRKVLKNNDNLRTRETQTYEYRSISVQPVREFGTQMQRVDLNIDDSKDMVLQAKPYMTSTELLYIKKTKALEIQRVWRGYTARCRAIRLRRNIEEHDEQVRQQMVETMAKHREEKVEEMKHRSQPRNHADFARLFTELDTWRMAEVAKIKANTAPGDERKKAMYELLEQETRALQNIEKLKYSAYKNINLEKTEKMLELMAQPQKWQMSDGEVALVQTPATLRAKELLELYKSLNEPIITVNERLEVLLRVKWALKEALGDIKGHTSGQFHKDIIDLVDREADLLNRGRPYKTMESLRTRISHLFLKFIENPTFNPRAADFITLPLPVPPANN